MPSRIRYSGRWARCPPFRWTTPENSHRTGHRQSIFIQSTFRWNVIASIFIFHYVNILESSHSTSGRSYERSRLWKRIADTRGAGTCHKRPNGFDYRPPTFDHPKGVANCCAGTRESSRAGHLRSSRIYPRWSVQEISWTSNNRPSCLKSGETWHFCRRFLRRGYWPFKSLLFNLNM